MMAQYYKLSLLQMKLTLLLLIVVTFITFTISHGANILVLSPAGTKSHKIFYMGIVNALAERGHNVTIVSPYKNSNYIKNVKDVVFEGFDMTSLMANVFDAGGSSNVMKVAFMESPRICMEGLATKEVQDLKKEKYDVVLMSMFFSHCYYSLIHHFQVPFIYLLPAGLFGPFMDMIGSIDFPSIAANKVLESTFPLSFIQRFQTIALNAVFTGVANFYMIPKTESLCKETKLCPPDMPPLVDFHPKASMAIVNSVKVLEYPPRPSMPNIIYAGGAHIKPGKPLSKELESWVQGAGEAGFIFFSLGSAVKPSDMPEKYRKTLVNVFGSLKQRVLWKWDEETMPDLPPNVRLGKWLPQQDILAHKKLRLFITHGGLLSTLEATYNGIPVLGMPVFADQYSNMNEAAGEGWARVLPWKELTEHSLKLIISEILFNTSLTEVSKKRSAIMKDVPVNPADEAAFWVEYVIRHEGAPHLRSPFFQLSWYEVNNLDVWAVIVLVVLTFDYICYRVIKAILRLCFGAKKGKGKNKKKKE